MGFIVPGLAKRLNERYGTLTNLGIASGLTLLGLIAIASAVV